MATSHQHHFPAGQLRISIERTYIPPPMRLGEAIDQPLKSIPSYRGLHAGSWNCAPATWVSARRIAGWRTASL